MTLLILFCFAWCYTDSLIPLIKHILRTKVGFSGGSDGKESACNVAESDSWVRKIPRRREWQPIPVFLPGEFHGHRSLVSYSAWGHKESDTTGQHTHTHTRTKVCTLGQTLSCRFLKHQFQCPYPLLTVILFHKSFGTVSAGCCGTDHKGDTSDPSDLGRLPGGIDL